MSTPNPSSAHPSTVATNPKTAAGDAHKTESAAASAPELSTPEASKQGKGRRRLIGWVAGAVCAGFALYVGLPWVLTAGSTVSTDDAYVNSHVTFVARACPAR